MRSRFARYELALTVSRPEHDVERVEPTRVRPKTGPAAGPLRVLARHIRTGPGQAAALAEPGAEAAAFAVPEVRVRRPVRRGAAHVSGNAEHGTAQGPGVADGTAAAHRGAAGGHGQAAGLVRHERAVPELGPRPDRHRDREGVRVLRRLHVQVAAGSHPVRRPDQNVRHARPEVQILAVARVRRRLLVALRRRTRDGPSRPQLGARRLRPRFWRRSLAVRRRKPSVHCGK